MRPLLKEIEMKNAVKKTAAHAKKFVSDHRVGLAFLTGASIGLVANKYALKAHDDFLTERGLYDEFYTPSDEEMGA
jgi:hypothetical protein